MNLGKCVFKNRFSLWNENFDFTLLTLTLFDNLSSIQEPVDWENQLFTPADAIILKPTKAHPKKKRKLQIDKSTTLSGEDIRNNLANPDSLVAAPVKILS